MSVWKSAVLWSGGLLLSGWAASAQAQACEGNADCPKGFTCEVTGGSACASPACAPGQKCPDPPPCENTVYRSCEPGPCAVDSDCAEGMVCYEQNIQTCTGFAVPPCAPGAKCPDPEPTVCKDESKHSCVPRYLLPCTDDNSCGAGFTCKEQESCSCAGSSGSTPPSDPGAGPQAPDAGSGSSGSGFAAKQPAPAVDGGQAPLPTKPPVPEADAGTPVDGGSAAPGPDPTCGCQPSGQKGCELNEIACKQDSDCPSHFTCENSAAANGVSSVDCAAAPGVDAGGCGAKPSQPVQPVLRCRPPYAAIASDLGVSKSDSESGSDPRSPIFNGSPGSASGGTTSGTAPATTASQDPSESAHDAAHAKACSVSQPGANPGSRDLGWLAATCAALGLTWVRRRRG